jgi:SAM-dependent MidA family methyltransferase
LSEVSKRITEEITDQGAITFARFMELALYCPNCGYYEKEEDNIGRRGDYYTSVSVGSLFGELLAFQFAAWIQEIEALSRESHVKDERKAVRIVEAGAHRADLARDILGWLREYRPGLFGRLEYWIVEPSAGRRNHQQRKLAEFSDQVRWADELAGLPGQGPSNQDGPHSTGLRGIIFSNELLDAMPTHRLGWDAKARVWFEWGVTMETGRFVWTRIMGGKTVQGRLQAVALFSLSGCQLPLEEGLLDILPDGFTTEFCPAAEQWWRAAAEVLECGKLVTIDYGQTAEEFFVPQRKDGTLRGYHHHQLNRDVLAYPGDQDITAHVNFAAIRAAGESAGLRTEGLLTQSQFLTRIAAQAWNDERLIGGWTPERARQFQTLTHPDHLGSLFRVLVQQRADPD